ncbi:MAG TPA: amino acid ABC transporter ATP-binding protein [Flexivirga sp.]|uniref:amino acid ABC transporter ATP-binding protein n=1 Tax=Flexivirga sp. TaxID=1962927 RepID=UPI002CB7B1ED|nr:amino acid ABC transporter ATP-binding protein [Flexivirga sp.]HWC22138.1 amino acid ABC transporter ATP-binding protein [Flexivirga sp.]
MSDLLRATGVAKRFGDHEVIKDVSFSVPRGTVTVIVGPSGSGKTTLLRGLNALERPDRGVVEIADVSVDFATIRASRRGRLSSADRALLRRYQSHSGMVFQGHNLFPHRTALQNVTEGPIVVQGQPAAEADEKARALLAKVGLADHADKFPYQLSGGQQQRVGIARALALEPDLLLFDEPTSALDPELVGEVLDVIRQLAREGRTMVIVTHEIRFARDVADHVLFIDGGVVVESGRPKDVLDHPQQERTQAFLHRLLEV